MAAEATLAAPPRQYRDVVFTFSYVNWAGAVGRGMNMAQDRFATRLLDEPKIERLILASPYHSGPRRLARRLVKGRPDPVRLREGARLHDPVRLRRSDPTSITAIARSMRRYDEQLRRAAERAGMDRPAVVTMNPLIAGFAPLEWAGPVTFYCSDDWSAAPAYRPWWPAYRETYARLRESGRAICAVSQPILDRVRPTGPSALVPNGIEPDEWWSVGPAPDWVAALPRPLVLYLGTLDQRLDADAVRAIAAVVGEGTLLLAGTPADPEHLRTLQASPNVRVVPRCPRHEIPALTRAADVCVIPHRRTPFTEAMSPLKAYEYLAAGRPVVAADLPPMRGIDERMRLIPEGGDYGAAVLDALELPDVPEDARLRFLEENAWSARHEAVLDVVLRPEPQRSLAPMST